MASIRFRRLPDPEGRKACDSPRPRTRGIPAGAWCRALAEFPDSEDGFRGRLLREALATRLKLPAVAGFRPGLFDRTRDKLSGRPRLMAVWEHWTAVRGVLRQLPQARLADPAAVRAEIRALRNAGLDPGLPPPLLHRLAMVSSLWGFSASRRSDSAGVDGAD